MPRDLVFRDSRGEKVVEGDHVMIYFGHNNLLPGVVKQVRGMGAKVLVDTNPKQKDPDLRYSLSKWKRGDCLVKVPDPYHPYPEEVYKLVAHMIEKRNSAESLEIRKAIHELINFWEGNRPLRLVTS